MKNLSDNDRAKYCLLYIPFPHRFHLQKMPLSWTLCNVIHHGAKHCNLIQIWAVIEIITDCLIAKLQWRYYEITYYILIYNKLIHHD